MIYNTIRPVIVQMFKCLVVCWANVLFVRMHRQQQRQTQVKKATEKAKQEDSFIVCWGRCCSKRRCCIWDKDKYKDRKPKSSLKGSLNMRRKQMLHFLQIKTGAVLLRCNCCICWIWAATAAHHGFEQMHLLTPLLLLMPRGEAEAK